MWRVTQYEESFNIHGKQCETDLVEKKRFFFWIRLSCAELEQRTLSRAHVHVIHVYMHCIIRYLLHTYTLEQSDYW